jgi:hypothetical protein
VLLPVVLALLASAAPARPSPPAAPAAGKPSVAPPTDPLERRRAEIADEMVRLGARLQKEIEAGDVGAVLARVPPEGLACGDRLVPRAKVERDLRDPVSWLHGVVFGAPGAAPASAGRATSLRGFFAVAKEVAVMVTFRRDPVAGAVGRPCLDFRARDLPTPGVPFCFVSRGGKWWLTESLYPCG